MWTQVFQSIQPVFVSEDCDSQTIGLCGVANAFIRDVRETCNTDPILCVQIRHVTNDILTAFDLGVTLSTYENRI